MRFGALITLLLVSSLLQAQWQEVQFDDIDMALDLTEALTFQKYPTYDQYQEMMQQFASEHPAICRLDTFGTSEEGRLLMALKISDHVELDEAESNFLYTSSMHGDELVGFVLMLRLANYLLKEYGNDPEVDNLVDNLSIWINPMANPDGSFSADNNMSLQHATRLNSRGIDLNRNFPDPGDNEPDDTTGVALENKHMMNFMKTCGFTMSANIHAGTEVVNYPWDHTLALHADDPWYRFISREYADEAMAVDPGYMFGWPDNGITNGAEWYMVNGGRQDYVNHYLEGREVTLELSNEKLLSSDYLDEFWNINHRSLLNYMTQCTYGIRGRVTSLESGNPIRALIHIPSHDNNSSMVHSSALHGDFYRLLKEGVYSLVVSAPGYLNDTIQGVLVTDYAATLLEVQMVQDPTTGNSAYLSSPGIRVYPNPAHGMIFIDPGQINPAPKVPLSMEIYIYSADGKLQLQQSAIFTGHPISLNIETLPDGINILRITTGDHLLKLMFLKQ